MVIARSEFGFKIPNEKSHYSFGMGIHRIITAYSGTFLVDPTTADLVVGQIHSKYFAA
jgi:hypothetical protein